jgi:putative DNA primase/helicase
MNPNESAGAGVPGARQQLHPGTDATVNSQPRLPIQGRVISTDQIERARSVRIEHEIARRGTTLRGRTERYGACPLCGGRDRFSFNSKKQVWNCRGCCVGGDVIALVRHLDGCDFQTAVRTLAGERPSPAPPLTPIFQPTAASSGTEVENYERKQHRKAARMWARRLPITGTLAERYLRGRGITCPLPPTIAYLPPAKPEHYPALIAAFALADEVEPGILGEPRNVGAVHLVLLRSDGSGKAFNEIEVQQGKRNKITVGSPTILPIVLAPPNDLLGLAVTEGIEDGFTAHQATGLGVWVAGSGSRMPVLANLVPEYIEAVTVYAHSDKTGQDGALALAEALSIRGIDVFVEGLR